MQYKTNSVINASADGLSDCTSFINTAFISSFSGIRNLKLKSSFLQFIRLLFRLFSVSDRSLSSVYQFKVSAEIKYLKIVVEITVLFAPKNLFSAMALSFLVYLDKSFKKIPRERYELF